MADFRFSLRAYSKIILHCAKYPHCAVNGVLLAESNKSKDLKKTKNLVFVDAIPLFHLCIHVSPMAELALIQIEAMAAASNLVIAGYYIANEAIYDMSIDKPANRIADKVVENFPSAVLVVVDNTKVTQFLDHPALVPYIHTEGKWKQADIESWTVEEGSLSITSDFLQLGMQKNLIDFDNHLDDISLSWRNKHINTKLEDITNSWSLGSKIKEASELLNLSAGKMANKSDNQGSKDPLR